MFISYKKQAQKLNDKIGGKWSIKKNYRRRDFNLGPFTWNTSALDHLALQNLDINNVFEHLYIIQLLLSSQKMKHQLK